MHLPILSVITKKQKVIHELNMVYTIGKWGKRKYMTGFISRQQ